MRLVRWLTIAGCLAGCGSAPAPAPAGASGTTPETPGAEAPVAEPGAGAEVAAEEPAPLAPDFTLPDLAGEQVTLSALRGKVVLVAFWSVD